MWSRLTSAFHSSTLTRQLKNRKMIFRQLFDRESCTYTYILGDAETKEAIIIDPVDTLVERDVEILEMLGLTLKYAVNTHIQ